MMLTGRAALNAGVVCYLRKPIDEQNLERCLRAPLASGNASEENSCLTYAPGKVN
jgi:YesN/AraC family two-component response regulator